MLDPQLLRSDPNDVARRLAERGYELDVNAWSDLEARRKALQVRVQELHLPLQPGGKGHIICVHPGKICRAASICGLVQTAGNAQAKAIRENFNSRVAFRPPACERHGGILGSIVYDEESPTGETLANDGSDRSVQSARTVIHWKSHANAHLAGSFARLALSYCRAVTRAGAHRDACGMVRA